MPLGLLGPVPVQAHHGGVVFESAACGVPDCGRQLEHGLPRVQVGRTFQQGGQVDALSVVFEHAVGEHEQTVPGAQIDILNAEGAGARVRVGHREPEGLVHLAVQRLHSPFAHAHRPGVAGVDELRPPGAQVDAQQLTGGVAVPVVDQRPVRSVSLLGQVGSGATSTAQSPYQNRGSQCRVEVVPHGIGHRQMQCAALQGVVERIAVQVFRGLQVSAQCELRGLARQGVGQQLVLDLRRQAGRPGALAPVSMSVKRPLAITM